MTCGLKDLSSPGTRGDLSACRTDLSALRRNQTAEWRSYDRAAHAALSFAAADLEWGDAANIFTPAVEVGENGQMIRRHQSPSHR